jgi:hypothetical protein
MLRWRTEGCMADSMTARKTGPAPTEMFLGHLCPIEEFRLYVGLRESFIWSNSKVGPSSVLVPRRYGYVTNTQVKVVAVLTEGETIREGDLKTVSAASLVLWPQGDHSA